MALHLSLALGAVFVQVALTLWAIYRMGMVRLAELRASRPDMGAVALGVHGYSAKVKQYENNTHNQFETPPLLYAGVALAAALGASNWGVAIGAVAFAGLRLWHRQIHVGHNNLRQRFQVYTWSLLALVVLWASLGLGLML